ncbi:MAG: hypothetical protein DMD99_17415 [Candidatus Rokuibacteriota bacterium]|nr:MAG: hypothetical protein DMD99_17415 [Candidatus Rokubacteria bacterium]
MRPGRTVVVTKERFAQGMTLAQYIDQMSANKARFVKALAETTITPDEAQALERLGATRRVMVITEDWCGTSLAEVPAMARMVEGNPGIEMRFFLRDANPDLMDQYLKSGLYRAIPVFALFDEHMNEVARFIEHRPR